MKWPIRITVLLSLLLLFHSPFVSADQKIRICSFNIAQLGSHAEERDEEAIARILHKVNPDIIVIQEVSLRQEGERQVQAITHLLNDLAMRKGRKPYCGRVSLVRTKFERYAFLWRPPVEKISGIALMGDTERYKGSIFVREPVYAYFKAQDFDFALMNVHLYTRIKREEKGRKFEYQQLIDWIKSKSEEKEKDYWGYPLDWRNYYILRFSGLATRTPWTSPS
jgi:endonuclease/exonuclease/phosphatase family metal-dependent hydrolase